MSHPKENIRRPMDTSSQDSDVDESLSSSIDDAFPPQHESKRKNRRKDAEKGKKTHKYSRHHDTENSYLASKRDDEFNSMAFGTRLHENEIHMHDDDDEVSSFSESSMTAGAQWQHHQSTATGKRRQRTASSAAKPHHNLSKYPSPYPSLNSIIFIEFHNIHGLQILYQAKSHPNLQVPLSYIADNYSLFLIPKPDLSNHIISFIVSDGEWLFIGCPQFMEHLRYERNALVWNIVLGFYLGSYEGWMLTSDAEHHDSPGDSDTATSDLEPTQNYQQQNDMQSIGRELMSTQHPFNMLHNNNSGSDGGMHLVDLYAPVLRKLTHAFRQMENEQQLISKHKSEIDRVLPLLLNQLNQKGEFSISVFPDSGSPYFLNGKLMYCNQFESPPEVQPWYVPVPKQDLNELVAPDWDLTVQKIIPFIDSIRFVKEIARCSNVHLTLVQKALRHLVFFDAITFTDVFQYSNVYAIDSRQRMSELFHNRDMQEEAVAYVSNVPSNTVEINDLLSLYSRFKFGRQLKTVLGNSEITNMIDHRSLVSYGVLRQFLVRIHEYPILRQDFDIALYESDIDNFKTKVSLRDLIPFLDGNHCIDEICVEFEISRSEILTMLGIIEDEYWIIHQR